MQTIRGLIALLLVAVAVFTGVTIFNNAMASRHEAKITQAAQNRTEKSAKQAAVGNASGADAHPQNHKTSL